jgi:capsular exopolysaccharide synthesis family protein
MKVKGVRYSQSLPLTNAAQFSENDEGGLNLGQILGAIRRRALLVVGITTIVAGAAALKALTAPQVYQSEFEILTESASPENQVISSLPESLSSKKELPDVVLDQTQLIVLKSPKLLSPIVKQLQPRYPDITYNSILSNLTIKSVEKNSNVLEVTYQSSDAEKVRVVLNLLAKAYLNYSLEERQRDIQQGIKFVDEQLPKLRSDVETRQGQLQKLRQRYNLIDPETQGKQLSEQLSTSMEKQLDTQVKLNETRSLYADLKKELARQSTESVASPVLKDNPRYQKILEQLIEVENQLTKESARFLDESPNIQKLREQRQNLLPLLSQEGQRVEREIASKIRELEAGNQSLTQTINRLNLEIKQLPVVAREYTDIQRELQISTNNLNQFLAKQAALRIDAAQGETHWQLLTPPSEPEPSSAGVKRNLALGTMLGLLLGLGAAVAADRLSNVFYTTKELKDGTRLPLLGIIPLEGKLGEFTPAVAALVQQSSNKFGLGNGQQAQQYIAAPFFEAFRSLYTNIRLLGSDTPIRSLVISSAVSAEGKSTVAVHLAHAAAAMGQRVLLVDADLRCPRLHEQMELINGQGLTDLISRDLDFNSIIQRSLREDNLFLLTAGLIPPDPIRLLASQKMQDLMGKLQAAFDLVIYDTPQLVGLADAYLLAAHTDGVVLIAGLGQLKRSMMEQALEELKVTSTPILGVVANKAKGSASSSYNHAHRYYTQTPSTVHPRRGTEIL